MHELYELKDMLCKELKEYGTKGELTAGSLDVVDKLTHTIKNLDKIIDAYEDDGYSGMNGDMGGSYRYSRERGNGGGGYRGRSYARRRDSMGRYSRGYSRDGDLVDQLHELMNDAPNDQIKREMQRLAEKIEQM